jgi:hypothetical protein
MEIIMDIKTFTKSKDEFGFSYCCNKCGKNQFYVSKPVECAHNPEPYEIEMMEDSKLSSKKLAELRGESFVKAGAVL